jgi:U3 small nucleolar RNA-associated protein 15
MSDGTLSVRRRQARPSEAPAGEFEIPLAALKAGAFDSFLGVLPNIGQGHVKSKGKSKPIGDADEFRIEARRRKKLREYDKLLKSFKYSAALDSVLRKVITGPLFSDNPSSHFDLLHSKSRP